MSNILLINPQTPKFVRHRDKSIPIGLLYLASTLQREKHRVELIDVNNDFLGFDERKRQGGGALLNISQRNLLIGQVFLSQIW
jgi:hypothetical protein